MKYDFDSYSDIGGRKNNEDSYIVYEDENGLIAAVADGLGGYESGEVASKMLTDEMLFCFKSEREFDIERAIHSANQKIIIEQKQNSIRRSMKTTAAAVWIGKDVTTFANIGDSRIYAFKNNQIIFQSRDHSLAQLAVQRGEIFPEQVRDYFQKNTITRALGQGDEIKVDINKVDNDSYDSILICSDGFWEYVLENEMCIALKESKDAKQWLNIMRNIHLCRISDNNDNNTAVVIMKK